jgi:hypothetical protein
VPTFIVYTEWAAAHPNLLTRVADVTIADGFTEIQYAAFEGCKGLKNLSFLKDCAVTTVGHRAFRSSSIRSLKGMERVLKVCAEAFHSCKDLRTIEGLGCEEMGDWCFAFCRLLKSMKGWPASMTVIPVCCFYNCTGMTTVDCDLSHVTSIGANLLGMPSPAAPRCSLPRSPRLTPTPPPSSPS